MWVKSLLLSAAIAVGANTAPVSAHPAAMAVQPNWVMPIQGRGGDNRQEQDIRPLREVVSELRARYGGDLIDARLEGGPRPIYVLRWRMPDGQVRDFRVNAAR